MGAQTALEEQNEGETLRAEGRPRRLRQTKDKLTGFRAEMLSKKAREKLKGKNVDPLLRKNRVKEFFTGLFGDNMFGGFLGGTFSWFAEKMGIIDEEVPWDEFFEEGKGNPEDIIVAHRSLGYGRHKENSIGAIEGGLDGGEKQFEIDLRFGKEDGGKRDIYLAHDYIGDQDDPEDDYTQLRDALELFATHEKNKNAHIFFDIKEKGVVTALDDMISEIDAKHSEDEGYVPLKGRHSIMSYDREVLEEAGPSEDRSLIFNYLPAPTAFGMNTLLKRIGPKQLKKACETMDKVAGTKLADDLEDTNVYLNGDLLSESPNLNSGVLEIFDFLPPESLLRKIDYICVPAPLTTKRLIDEARNKGIKVAVWGAEGAQLQALIANLGPDLVISDAPNVIN